MSRTDSLDARIRPLNPSVDLHDGLYVAYWMVASRRAFWNPALERAAHWSRVLGQSLLVCEPLRRKDDGGQLRMHRFLLDGMLSNARRFAYAGVLYHPFVESEDCREEGLLEAVARRASVWVTDRHASTDLGDSSHLVRGARLPIRAEAVDGECIAPDLEGNSGAHDRADINRFHEQFRPGLLESLRRFPARNPLAKFFETHLQAVLPHITGPWPAAEGLLLSGAPDAIGKLGLSGPPAFPDARGGSDAAFESWRELIGELSGADSDGTPRAAPAAVSGHERPAVPDRPPAIGGRDLAVALRDEVERPERYSLLGYHLAAGHLSSYQVLVECLRHCRWTPEKLGPSGSPAREWWGLPDPVADLLETFVVRRDWELVNSFPLTG